MPGSAGIGSERGARRRRLSSAAAGSMRTRTSYQPAWPVIGSELEMRLAAVPGSSSEIRWFSRKPRCASFASGARRQAPGALPIAFQVHTVAGSTASE